MARRDVIEVTCDRCGRTETQSSTEAHSGEGPEFKATLQGEEVAFDDLCRRCRDAVRGYFTRISKKTDDQPASSNGASEAAAPSTPEVKKDGFLGRVLA